MQNISPFAALWIKEIYKSNKAFLQILKLYSLALADYKIWAALRLALNLEP